jgi:hypothetical protein
MAHPMVCFLPARLSSTYLLTLGTRQAILSLLGRSHFSPRMRSFALCGILALAIAVHPAAMRADTLGSVLARNGIPATGREASDLNRKITSFAFLDAPDSFVIAYYPDDGDGRVGDTLKVDLYRKGPSTWLTQRFERDATGGAEGHPAFGGSVERIFRSAGFLLLETHVNPSAAYTLVLDKDLTYRDSISGWPLAVFRDGLVVYQHSEIHFAPTHYAEVSVYSLGAKKQWLIYPRKPYQPVRQAHVEKVRAAYAKRGAEWFAAHNHHGNPELFDNFLQGEVAANEATHALAFRIAFDNTDTWDYAEKLKFQNFGGLARRLADFNVSKAPPEGIFAVLGEGLLAVKSLHLQDTFLELFKADPDTQAMLMQALASPEASQPDWQKRLVGLDVRWAQPEQWRKIQATLSTPPETTDVICVIRNLDQERNCECREMLLDDFQKRLGDRPLSEYLEPEQLAKIFAQ